MNNTLANLYGIPMSRKSALLPLLAVTALCTTIDSKAQTWSQVDLVDFNNLTYESDYITNGSVYYENAASPPSGPRNGLINGAWEETNTNLGLTQSPNSASGGRFLMYWTHNGFTSSAPAGVVFSKTYTGLIIGHTYRYSFKYAFLLQTGGSVSNAPTFNILRDGSNSQSVATATTNWATATITFIATATSHTIAINNSQTAVNGNDFGLDDIKLEVQQSALPITLSYFKANRAEDGVQLEWETQRVQQAKGFEAERSTDGKNWYMIGFIPVYGENNAATQKYSYVDKTTLSSSSYYRLKLIDIDNSFEYSTVVKAKNAIGKQVLAFPNPLHNEINLHGLEVGDRVSVYDMAGRSVLQQTTKSTQMTIPIQFLAPGFYLVKVVFAEGQEQILKMLKE